jgi:hypothetical protein
VIARAIEIFSEGKMGERGRKMIHPPVKGGAEHEVGQSRREVIDIAVKPVGKD